MTPKEQLRDTRESTPHYFIVAGISLTSIRKELKPALPKKRQKASYLVVITTAVTSVKVAIAGAAIELPAITSGSFTVELPYLMFESVLMTEHESGAFIRFEVDTGSFTVNGVATKSRNIIFQPGVAMPDQPQAVPIFPTPPERHDVAVATRIIANPLDATVGLPLMTAYVHLRKYGFQPHAASQSFAAQQVKVDRLLQEADRILRPLGVTRADLERVLDRKAGID